MTSSVPLAALPTHRFEHLTTHTTGPIHVHAVGIREKLRGTIHQLAMLPLRTGRQAPQRKQLQLPETAPRHHTRLRLRPPRAPAFRPRTTFLTSPRTAFPAFNARLRVASAHRHRNPSRSSFFCSFSRLPSSSQSTTSR